MGIWGRVAGEAASRGPGVVEETEGVVCQGPAVAEIEKKVAGVVAEREGEKEEDAP